MGLRRVENRNGSIVRLVLILLAAAYMIPLLFIIFTALKSRADFFTASFWSPPRKWMFVNFQTSWTKGHLYIYGFNSIVISAIKVPLGIFVSLLAAFAVTRMRFRFANATFLFLYIGIMLPVNFALAPLMILYDRTKLLNTYIALMIPYVAFGIPFQVFYFRGFLRTLPNELDEAALMDGCGDFQRFWRILVPLTTPSIAAMVILDFPATWNEFIMAQTFIFSDKLRTIPQGIYQFRFMYVADNQLICATVLILTLPILLVYVFFQRYFISGMITGSMKG